MLPLNTASSVAVVGDLLFPDDHVVSTQADFELGGVAIGDTSKGLSYQPWCSHVDDAGRVRLQPVNATSTIVHTEAGITELAFTFDQAMRPVLTYVVAGLTRLRWYDSTITAYRITDFPGVRSPRLALDERRYMLSAISGDVIFAYVKGHDICYRQQRDAYAVEYTLHSGVAENQRLQSIGMNSVQRMQFEVL